MRTMLKCLVGLSVCLCSTPSVHALNIDINYPDPGAWNADMRTVVEDAVAEWEEIYCPNITIFIDFTWHAFVDKDGNPSSDWGETGNYQEDPSLHLPFSADVELNTRIATQYYWDMTPRNTNDDAGKLMGGGDSSIDAASVLKHEVFHAIGFTTQYTKFASMRVKDGDLDGDGKNEYFLDFNGNGNYDAGETVLSDTGSTHTDDGFYGGASRLMGYPGFGFGEQARPSDVEIVALANVYGYPIHPPEPTIIALLVLGGSLLYRRTQAR